jgi:hypothetical protein
MVACRQPLRQRRREDVERLLDQRARVGLEGAQQRDVDLQDDLGWRVVHLDEAADVDIGALLRLHVVGLEVVPRELDELLPVLHQLLGRVLDKQRRQLEQLDAQRLVVRGELLAAEQLVDDGGDDVGREQLLGLAVGEGGGEQRQHQQLQGVHLVVGRRLGRDEEGEEVTEHRRLVRRGVGGGHLAQVEGLEEVEVDERVLREDRQHEEEQVHLPLAQRLARPGVVAAVGDEALDEQLRLAELV